MIEKLRREKGHLSIAALTVDEFCDLLDSYRKGEDLGYGKLELIKLEEEKLVDLEDLEKELGISRSTVYRLRQKGIFPEYQIGKKVKFKLHEVKKAIRVNV